MDQGSLFDGAEAGEDVRTRLRILFRATETNRKAILKCARGTQRSAVAVMAFTGAIEEMEAMVSGYVHVVHALVQYRRAAAKWHAGLTIALTCALILMVGQGSCYHEYAEKVENLETEVGVLGYQIEGVWESLPPTTNPSRAPTEDIFP